MNNPQIAPGNGHWSQMADAAMADEHTPTDPAWWVRVTASRNATATHMPDPRTVVLSPTGAPLWTP